MSYALESQMEVRRLEKQSETESYDFKKELMGLDRLDLNGKVVCDAGCGSGIVSRFIARKFPQAQVIACDASELRIQQSKKLSTLKNLSFQVQDVKKTTFQAGAIDLLVSRFVVEHFSKEDRNDVLNEFYRCIKPGGRVCIIDIDGLYLNVYPKTGIVKAGLRKLQNEKSVDLFIGRKLPRLLEKAGFKNLEWEVQTLSFSGEALQIERDLFKERFQAGAHFFTRVNGSPEAFAEFRDAYLDLLAQSGTTLHCTKWIVWGQKPISS